ncbi:hypothetical protein HN51_046615 [Arachis hypogaea]
MKERRRGCSVATEAPPPLLGLVAIAVLPLLGCCAATEELEGMSCRRRALSLSRCVAAHHHRCILCHHFESGYGFDSDDELQRLIKIEKIKVSSKQQRFKLHFEWTKLGELLQHHKMR